MSNKNVLTALVRAEKAEAENKRLKKLVNTITDEHNAQEVHIEDILKAKDIESQNKQLQEQLLFICRAFVDYSTESFCDDELVSNKMQLDRNKANNIIKELERKLNETTI